MRQCKPDWAKALQTKQACRHHIPTAPDKHRPKLIDSMHEHDCLHPAKCMSILRVCAEVIDTAIDEVGEHPQDLILSSLRVPNVQLVKIQDRFLETIFRANFSWVGGKKLK